MRLLSKMFLLRRKREAGQSRAGRGRDLWLVVRLQTGGLTRSVVWKERQVEARETAADLPK